MQYWEPCIRSERNSARMFESIYGMIGIDVPARLARLFRGHEVDDWLRAEEEITRKKVRAVGTS